MSMVYRVKWKHQLKQNTCMELKLINVLTVFFLFPIKVMSKLS